MQSFSITDIGMRRKMNQDFVSATDESVGKLPNLYLLADGMGGHKAGDYASRFAVRETLRLAAANREDSIHGILEEALHVVNYNLHMTANMRDDLRGCGTTIVAASVEQGGMLLTANVGDSRLYVSGRDGLRQITVDHSLVEEMILAGSLDAKKARNHPDKNVITRAVGAEEEVDIDFFNTQLEAGDLVLMCSDGLTNMVEDEEIQQILRRNETLESKARALVMTANLNGGLDNISVILMDPFA
jgi:PPM family protein phosphatase